MFLLAPILRVAILVEEPTEPLKLTPPLIAAAVGFDRFHEGDTKYKNKALPSTKALGMWI